MLSLQNFVFIRDAASAATMAKIDAGRSDHDWYACKTVTELMPVLVCKLVENKCNVYLQCNKQLGNI